MELAKTYSVLLTGLIRKEINEMKNNLYEESYFKQRKNGNDKRNLQYVLDLQFIEKYISSGVVCDVGCGTGDFDKAIHWAEAIFGIEVSEHAKLLAAPTVRFDKDIFSEIDFFDLVIFRGTIQHVENPFEMLRVAHRSLKRGGFICFLATPNANSPLYRRKNALPFIEPKYNYWIPSDRTLSDNLLNLNFVVQEIEYPYWNTQYRRAIYDHISFIVNFFTPKFIKHAFWKSSMNLIAKKL
jgi:SAM-dependent methyltransferase